MMKNKLVFVLAGAIAALTLSPGHPAAQSFSAGEAGRLKGTVGTCNTDAGCKILERACLKAKGTYHDVEGEDLKGTCTTEDESETAGTSAQLAIAPQRQQSGGTQDLAAKTGPAEDSFCHSATFCEVLKQVCPTSGGTYKDLPGGGVCKDPE